MLSLILVLVGYLTGSFTRDGWYDIGRMERSLAIADLALFLFAVAILSILVGGALRGKDEDGEEQKKA